MRHDELKRFVGKSALPGLTVIPISLYTKGSLVKVKIAIGRGKRQVDKRESIKKREVDRRIRRLVRS
jgi:SsrA-binding protein